MFERRRRRHGLSEDGQEQRVVGQAHVRLVDEGHKRGAGGRIEFERQRTVDEFVCGGVECGRLLLDECGRKIGVRMGVLDAGKRLVVGRNELLDLFHVVHVDALLLDGGGRGLQVERQRLERSSVRVVQVDRVGRGLGGRRRGRLLFGRLCLAGCRLAAILGRSLGSFGGGGGGGGDWLFDWDRRGRCLTIGRHDRRRWHLGRFLGAYQETGQRVQMLARLVVHLVQTAHVLQPIGEIGKVLGAVLALVRSGAGVHVRVLLQLGAAQERLAAMRAHVRSLLKVDEAVHLEVALGFVHLGACFALERAHTDVVLAMAE